VLLDLRLPIHEPRDAPSSVSAYLFPVALTRKILEQMFATIRSFVDLRQTGFSMLDELPQVDQDAVNLHVSDCGYDYANCNDESIYLNGGDFYDSF